MMRLLCLLLTVHLVTSYQKLVQWRSPLQLTQQKTWSRLQDCRENRFKDVRKQIISTVVGISTLVGTTFPSFAADYPLFNEVWKIVDENFVDNTYNNHDWNQIRDSYLKKLDSGADERELTKSMLTLLGDKYTRLLDKAVFESLWKYDAIGVGLLFQSDPGKRMFVAAPPISGSSSAKAGIKKGDIIFSINGKLTDGMTAIDVLDKMSNDNSKTVVIEYGTPAVSDPALTAGAGLVASAAGTTGGSASVDVQLVGDIKKVELDRATEVAKNPVSYSLERRSDGQLVGYVRLAEFNSEAVPGLRNAIEAIKAQNVDEMLLDLRGNTGGGFQFALNIGGMLMGDKPMVTAAGKDNNKNTFRTSYPDGQLFEKPLVVLADGLSASASEVLMAGLQDNCRAAVAGSKSFGKGKIQAVFGLADGEGMTMTVAQYVSPKGKIIQSTGVIPDLPIPTLNPYVNMILGPTLTKPDVDQIDFLEAKEILKQCKPL